MRQTTPVKKVIRQSPELLRLRKKRRNARIRLGILFSVFFVTLIVGVVYFFRYPSFQIAELSVSGNQIVETSDIEAYVKNKLVGKYAYFIPRKNIYLYPKNAIKAGLLSAFPRIADVSIARVSNNHISIQIKEARVIALWCGDTVHTVSSSLVCYFTDSEGKVVAEAPYYSGDIYTRFFGGMHLIEGESPLGKYVLTKNEYNNLLAFSLRVKDMGLPVMAIAVLDSGENQILLDVAKNKTAPIRFYAKDDYRTLSSNLSAAISKPELSAKFKLGKELLEYFDLRFKNKVYYKFSEPTNIKTEEKAS